MLSRAEREFVKGEFVRASYAISLERRIKVKLYEMTEDLEMIVRHQGLKELTRKLLTQVLSGEVMDKVEDKLKPDDFGVESDLPLVGLLQKEDPKP